MNTITSSLARVHVEKVRVACVLTIERVKQHRNKERREVAEEIANRKSWFSWLPFSRPTAQEILDSEDDGMALGLGFADGLRLHLTGRICERNMEAAYRLIRLSDAAADEHVLVSSEEAALIQL